jgi:putative transposase
MEKGHILRVSVVKLRKPSNKFLTRYYEVINRLRFLYNCSLEQKIKAYKHQKVNLSYNDQCKELTLIRNEFPEYENINVDLTRLTVLVPLHSAFKGFFRRVKNKEAPGFPRFKGRDRLSTLIYGTTGWKLKGKKLCLANIGSIGLKKLPHRGGEIVGLRLVKRVDGFYAQFLVDIGTKPNLVPIVNIDEEVVGMDMGLDNFVALSTGELVKNPRYFKKFEGELTTLQRKVSSKKRGSKRRQKAKTLLARKYRKVVNKRTRFCHELAKQLVNKYKGFAIEDLDVKGMLERKNNKKLREKNPNVDATKLHKSIGQAAWIVL